MDMGNIHKIWGERRRILLTDRTEIDLLYLKANSFCSTHRHKDKSNLFYVVKGEVRIETEFGNKVLKANECWTVKPPLTHRFVPLTDGIMIEIAYVDKGKIDPDDIERFSQGGRIVDGKEITFNELRDLGLLDLRGKDGKIN